MADSIDWEKGYARRAERMRASEIRELLKVLSEPGILSFAGGIPDPALFPTDAVGAAAAEILAHPQLGGSSLQYSVSEGYAPLREWIAGHMGRLGVPCTIDNIVITAGSQQGLDFLGKLFVSAGDTVLVTSPTYLGALQAFSAYEPRYDVLTPEEPGRDAAGYRVAASAAASRLALAYVVSDFANPTGETLSRAARERLLALTTDLGIPLVEDAAYQAIRFEGDAIPPCLTLAVRAAGDIERTRVIYCGTFSKTIAPGLRVGWLCAARPLIQKVVLAKQAADLHSSTFNQMLMHRVATRIYDQQVARNVAHYAGRRDAMLAALERHMPPDASWTRPRGGMFVWVTLPPSLDGAALLARTLREERIAFVPGHAFFADGAGRNTIRLNYSLLPPEDIDDGVRRLAGLIRRTLEEAGHAA